MWDESGTSIRVFFISPIYCRSIGCYNGAYKQVGHFGNRRQCFKVDQPEGRDLMSKYDALWAWIKENGTDSFRLTFDEIERIGGLPIDHSFLTYKKELMGIGSGKSR